jgi:hypothetical protein
MGRPFEKLRADLPIQLPHRPAAAQRTTPSGAELSAAAPSAAAPSAAEAEVRPETTSGASTPVSSFGTSAVKNHRSWPSWAVLLTRSHFTRGRRLACVHGAGRGWEIRMLARFRRQSPTRAAIAGSWSSGETTCPSRKCMRCCRSPCKRICIGSLSRPMVDTWPTRPLIPTILSCSISRTKHRAKSANSAIRQGQYHRQLVVPPRQQEAGGRQPARCLHSRRSHIEADLGVAFPRPHRLARLGRRWPASPTAASFPSRHGTNPNPKTPRRLEVTECESYQGKTALAILHTPFHIFKHVLNPDYIRCVVITRRLSLGKRTLIGYLVI